MFPSDTTVDVRDQRVAVLPVGSTEQHGPHLPLATDSVIAWTIASEISKAHQVRLLPPIQFSCSQEHADWPGTVSISARTLISVVTDIADSLRRNGVTGLVLVNGHGGNYVLSNIVQESTGLALFPGRDDWAFAREKAGIETSAYSDMHAGELETSILLHAHPDLIRPGYETSDHLAEDRRHMLTLGLAPYTESGVIGRPSLASARKGELLLAGLTESFRHYLDLFGPGGAAT
ncbi:creatininase family protein [Lentzea sp. BCCO 10_0856]|uniref:Creatininase family protein n=1 Tax=Lentzea miocenica TaxID=3095431 RepID=A0ABU4T486_9PSEU|nr:creatininase family protein [Lentzea sp. BCCO 10_0856]MDX8032889.1 creatininase family protein [Lentzea sp. BCCO 10_0856]